MKKLLFSTILFSLIGLSSTYSQFIDGKSIEEINADYIQLNLVSKSFSAKVSITVNFGQEIKIASPPDMFVRDENGEKINFNSEIDAFNFFSKYGYRYLEKSNTTDLGFGSDVHSYLFVKENK